MGRFATYVMVIGLAAGFPGGEAELAEVADAAPYGRTGAGETLTLPEAIRTGLVRNPALLAQRAEAGASGADLEAALAARWPRVFTEASWHATDNPVAAFGDKLTSAQFAAADFAIDSLNHPDAVDHAGAALVLEAPLYTSGRIRAGIEAGRETSLASLARVRGAESDLVARITIAYHGVSLAAAAVLVAESAVTSASGHERVARARFENGAALKSDFLRARVHRLARQRELERKRADRDLAHAGLRLLLGLPQDEPLAVADSDMTPPADPPGDLRDWIDAAAAERQEIEAARRSSLAAAAAGRAAGAARGPEVAGTARFERNAAGLEAGEGSFFAGVGIRWTAFDRGRAARIEAARQRAAAAAATSRAIEDAVRLEVERAYRDAGVAARSLAAAQQAVAAAEEALRISVDRYASGLLPLTDLLDAETGLVEARLAEIAARHDTVIGRVLLQRAAGRLEVPR
ncbi:MAG: TolC family protein [Acidobacteria bacterium]|nr:TolC family protein [Acidobacteriota bacterium]